MADAAHSFIMCSRATRLNVIERVVDALDHVASTLGVSAFLSHVCLSSVITL
jgi:hypothetical protein